MSNVAWVIWYLFLVTRNSTSACYIADTDPVFPIFLFIVWPGADAVSVNTDYVKVKISPDFVYNFPIFLRFPYHISRFYVN